MKIEEYFDSYSSMDVKTKVKLFNELSIKERKAFLSLLSENEYSKFIGQIRVQAVADFWTHEQQLIKNGQSTRNWTPEQIEAILNISESEGIYSINGGKAIVLDENGNPILKKYGDKWINEVYEGHHMLNVAEHPEYAGDWRNIQALCRSNNEHINAHKGKFSNNTNWYYNESTGEIIDIVVLDNINIFDTIEDEYPPKHSSIFKSDAEIKAIYSQCNNLNDAEILALKNIEYSMDVKGGLVDFNRGLDVANRYNSPDLYKKIGIMSDDAIQDKYYYFSDMDATDVDTFKAYEYFKLREVDDECIEKLGVKSDNTLLEQYKFLDENDLTIDKIRTYEYQKNKAGAEALDTKVYFDSEGKVIGLSCYDDVPSNMVLELNLSETEHYLSDADMSSKYMGYDTYTPIQKLQMQQLELDARNHEMAKIKEFIDADTTGNLDSVRITFDADGNVSGIDMSGMSGGSSLDISKSNAVFDISSNGDVKVRLDKPMNGNSWWQDEILSILENDSVKSINGVPTDQFKNLYNNLTAAGSPNVLNKINDAIADIPTTNVNENTLINNLYTGKSMVIDKPKNLLIPNKSNGMKVAASLRVFGILGDGADVVDVATTFTKAYHQYQNGDIEGASDKLAA